ncbi:Lrp/AsnC family transcriptional regulator [Streptomyces gamaensis]|uniref:Lrp/AsnC family transcriptional regulator n=1 Tax=Streptomyces gamaensis TaxID=1763542 RepID=A0ABW0Z418_9ACTN
MTETPELDGLDRRLIACLRADGRASFRRLAQRLAVSEQTVARRYHRLRSAHLLRVTVLPAPPAIGRSPLLLRVRTEGSAGQAVAARLARRPDIPWIETLAGTTDLVFTALTRPGTEDTGRLLDGLSRTRGVRETVPCLLLRLYTEPTGSLADGPLLDAFEQRLLAALEKDGRAAYGELAPVLGTTPATVRRRLERLLAAEALQVRTEADLALLGFPIEATLWLDVRPDALEAAGSALAAHPEVRFAAATTGPSNLMVSTFHATLADLYRMQTETLGGLDGVQHVEITPTVRVVKRHGILRDGHTLRN